MANDNNEELLDLDMESGPESSWWTSTNNEEDVATLMMGSRGKNWDVPSMKVFHVLGFRVHRVKGLRRRSGKERRAGVTGTFIKCALDDLMAA